MRVRKGIVALVGAGLLTTGIGGVTAAQTINNQGGGSIEGPACRSDQVNNRSFRNFGNGSDNRNGVFNNAPSNEGRNTCKATKAGKNSIRTDRRVQIRN